MTISHSTDQSQAPQAFQTMVLESTIHLLKVSKARWVVVRTDTKTGSQSLSPTILHKPCQIWRNLWRLSVDWATYILPQVHDYHSLEIFRWWKISLVKFLRGFIFVAMTTWQCKLTPFIRRRKYFIGLIFNVEGDRWKFLHAKNFLIYGIRTPRTCIFVLVGLWCCGFWLW